MRRRAQHDTFSSRFVPFGREPANRCEASFHGHSPESASSAVLAIALVGSLLPLSSGGGILTLFFDSVARG